MIKNFKIECNIKIDFIWIFILSKKINSKQIPIGKHYRINKKNDETKKR